jgi:hypothetical protein
MQAHAQFIKNVDAAKHSGLSGVNPKKSFYAFDPRTADGSFVSPLICGLFKTPSHIFHVPSAHQD